MDKAEIDKEITKTVNTVEMWTRSAMKDKTTQNELYDFEQLMIKNATSSLTTLIIKWLESKKAYLIDNLPKDNDMDEAVKVKDRIDGRNQLITELIGELR